MPKRGVSQREKEAIIQNVQNLSLKSLLEKITDYLQKHPQEAGPTWIALMDGWMSSTAAASKSLKVWLPDSNSRMIHVAS